MHEKYACGQHNKKTILNDYFSASVFLFIIHLFQPEKYL